MAQLDSQDNKGKIHTFLASKLFLGTTIYGTSFVDGFLYGIIVPVLPFSLIERSHVPATDVQFWNSSLLIIFGLAFCFGCGVLSWSTRYTYTRRLPIVFGLLIALASTILFIFVKSTGFLILCRCLQGLASGFLFTGGLALVSEVVPPEESAAWIGLALSGADIGILVAPSLAGLVYEKAGYEMVFVIGAVLIALELVLVALLVIEPKALHEVDGATSSNDDDSTSATQAIVATERTSLLPTSHSGDTKTSSGVNVTLQMLRSPRVLTAIYGCLVAISVVSSFDATLTIFVQRTFHWSSAQAGALFLALSVPSFLAPGVGVMADKYGIRLVTLLGCVISTLALLGLTFTGQDSTFSKIILCVLCVCIGLSYNLILIPLSAELGNNAEALFRNSDGALSESSVYVQAFALQGYAMGLGNIIGPFVSGAVLETGGWAVESLVLATIVATVTMPVFFYIKEKQKD